MRNGKSIVLVGLVCLAAGIAVVTAGPVQAQAGAKISDVRVVNSPAVRPISQREPFNLSTYVVVPAGEFYGAGTGNNAYTVPAGKVLVVETVAVTTSTPDFAIFRLVNQANNRGFAFVGHVPYINGGIATTVVVNARIPAGETTGTNVSCTGNTGDRTVFFILNGYLEPAP